MDLLGSNRARIVAILVVLLSLGACATVEEPPVKTPVTTPPEDISSSALADDLALAFPTWLDQQGNQVDLPLQCLTGANGVAQSSTEDVEVCLDVVNGSSVVRVKNAIGVPITLWGDSTVQVVTLLPGAIWSVQLRDAYFGQIPLFYEVNLAAAMGASVLDYGVSKTLPAYEMQQCARQPDEECVFSTVLNGIAEVAPDRVRITLRGRSINVPVGTLTEALGIAVDNREVISATRARASGVVEGHISLLANN